ncbi:MAG TPA: hypothetical protein ENF55_01695 [Thermoprotei archaeon]|nr:MAG: hypothetical protein DRJ63_01465 [Thermoprotei archaeon]HDI74649.1 hypothetical protein [Thermoprotei archaeon]
MTIPELLSEVGIKHWCVLRADKHLIETFPLAKSIIVFYIPFTGLTRNNIHFKVFEAFSKAAEVGVYLAKRLLEENVFACYIPPFAEVVPLEKYAARGGLGVVGRSGWLVSPEYGPRVVVAGVVTGLEFEKTTLLKDFNPCKDCFACVAFCPQDAIGLNSVKRYKCTYCFRCVLVCPVGMIYNEEFI